MIYYAYVIKYMYSTQYIQIHCTYYTIGGGAIHYVHTLKLGGGPKPLLNLKVSRSLILIYIKLSKILIHALSTKNAVGC